MASLHTLPCMASCWLSAYLLALSSFVSPHAVICLHLFCGHSVVEAIHCCRSYSLSVIMLAISVHCSQLVLCHHEGAGQSCSESSFMHVALVMGSVTAPLLTVVTSYGIGSPSS